MYIDVYIFSCMTQNFILVEREKRVNLVSVRLDHVLKQYDSLEEVTLTGYKRGPALNRVNLTINDGETMSVVGPSGCGKSTLLKVVAGLEYPNQGKIFYDDFDMTLIKPQDRGIGMVFQDYALYPTMKGKGNLAYYFEQHASTKEEMEARVRQTAEMMGVDFEFLLGRLPDTLSGGEKQRVAIARCIVRDPHVFLMDEPIVNLDAKRRESTRMEIKKLLKKFKITALYVTHDQKEAVFMGDRITVMRDGNIEQVGTFDELYYAPANLFVATFIGTPPISIIPVDIADRQIVLSGMRWPLPAELQGQIPPGKVRMGVRPEGWLLDQPDGMPLSVRHIERLPTESASFIHGTLINGSEATVLAPLDYPNNRLVNVTPNWDQLYLFDIHSEAALHVPSEPDLF